MAVGLSSYLLKQGLAADQITILTPYTSQLKYVFLYLSQRQLVFLPPVCFSFCVSAVDVSV
jgi:hypothetical protein